MMTLAQKPDPVKAFFALLGSTPGIISQAIDRLVKIWGAMDIIGDPQPFAHTNYYRDEMGDDLQRQFISLQQLVDPGLLPSLKKTASSIEQDLCLQDSRQVNIDPGYLDFNKVVLASYKFGGQKVYLSDGVYADIILLFAKGKFEPFAWTFPDFSSGSYDSFLLQVRRKYKEQRKPDLLK